MLPNFVHFSSDLNKFGEDRVISLSSYEFCENGYNYRPTLRKDINAILSHFVHLSSCLCKSHYRISLFHETLHVNGAAESVTGIGWTWYPRNGTSYP
jgi:hypothetical protein